MNTDADTIAAIRARRDAINTDNWRPRVGMVDGRIVIPIETDEIMPSDTLRNAIAKTLDFHAHAADDTATLLALLERRDAENARLTAENAELRAEVSRLALWVDATAHDARHTEPPVLVPTSALRVGDVVKDKHFGWLTIRLIDQDDAGNYVVSFKEPREGMFAFPDRQWERRTAPNTPSGGDNPVPERDYDN